MYCTYSWVNWHAGHWFLSREIHGGVYDDSLQAYSIHVFLVAPYIAHLGINQHEGRITVRKATYFTNYAHYLAYSSAFRCLPTQYLTPLYFSKKEQR